MMAEPFYRNNFNTLYQKNCRDMSEIKSESVDLLATDPPYGLSFMGKDWDKALPDKQIWCECLRVLKPGAFAFVMSIPRADCLSRMIISIEDAGFLMNFTPIFWAYATGFPKATNISKAIDKRLGANREDAAEGGHRGIIVSEDGHGASYNSSIPHNIACGDLSRGTAISSEAQALDGSYAGYQPKPAVEVVIVAMKPLSEKTYVDQALKNGKGVTWLDRGRIPFINEKDAQESENKNRHADFGSPTRENKIYGQDNRTRSEQGNYSAEPGRFPANLLVSDDALNDGKITISEGGKTLRGKENKVGEWGYKEFNMQGYGDSGSFSRYFDLDAWWAKNLPFLIVPKASKSEKNKGLDMPHVVKSNLPLRDGSSDYIENEYGDGSMSTRSTRTKNYHPTVKPVKLLSYLITLGSREGDVVLDNFAGSGTTGVAASLLGRKCIMYEIKKEYCEIAAGRCSQLALDLTSQ